MYGGSIYYWQTMSARGKECLGNSAAKYISTMAIDLYLRLYDRGLCECIVWPQICLILRERGMTSGFPCLTLITWSGSSCMGWPCSLDECWLLCRLCILFWCGDFFRIDSQMFCVCHMFPPYIGFDTSWWQSIHEAHNDSSMPSRRQMHKSRAPYWLR